MRRFFVPPDLLAGREVNLPPELARRLATVLRLKRGDRLVLADGAGRDYEVELTAVSPRSATAAVVAERPSPPEPSLELVLYQSLIRTQRFELVLEKGTELGVSRFVPLLSGRARVRMPDAAGEGGSQRLQRWRRIVTEAAEQSGRGRVPAIEPPSLFEDAVRSASGLLLLPWEGERSQGLRSYLRSLGDRPLAASLFIGPEGGFAEDEVRLAREAGCVPISLGPRILRSETAGIVAAALVMHELGEMGG
ncbi:MAG: 16S rRNA (uracil(1498)-N(3))-methyltransferase [Chloroflexi bacterium]|nr:16S rRNA (uracil(1498)-N(3))-methyltransferase [Chloroflexota bacterium]